MPIEPDPLLPDRSLPAHFERCARAYADRTAIVSEGDELTFTELNVSANRLAHRIIAAGGNPGDRVAILKTQDLRSYTAMLAILKAGRVMIALNPEDPAARLGELLADAEPTVIITDAREHQRVVQLAGGRAAIILADDDLSALPATDPGNDTSLADVAALVYTSGTTGRPKGVMQTHGQLLRNARMSVRAMNIVETDRIVLVASLWGGQGIDTVWIALSAGARLTSYPASVHGVTGLGECLRDHRISIYLSAASLFRHFVRTVTAGAVFPDMRCVRLSSDPPTVDDFRAAQRHFPNAELAHDAGMSEVGRIGLIVFPRGTTMPAAGRLPLRPPEEGLTTRIVDETGEDAPVGAVGSIVLTSPHMAKGYWRDPDLTARHFSTAPDGMRVFRSGDLGRIDENGLLFLAGRKDATHKIRGQRVDLSEVERGLSDLSGIGSVAAGVVARANGEAELVAYVVPLPGTAPTAGKLRATARARMARHLVPSAFVFLDRMPLAGNGKVDRMQLAKLAPPAREKPAEAPVGMTEIGLARIWQEAFDLDAIGRNDDFFELGGDSLISAVIGARAHAAFGVELHFADFVEHPQLSAMAAMIDGASVAAAMPEADIPLLPVDRASPVPLSLLQTVFWRAAAAPHNAMRWTVASALRIEGHLDLDAMRGAIGDVFARQETLRTRFDLVDGMPAQVVVPPAPLDMPLVELDGDVEDRLEALLAEERRRLFDLRAAPPLKLTLVRGGAELHWLVQSSHHIISDAFSWQVFVDDLGVAYAARVLKRETGLPKLTVQFADHAVWQRRVWRSDGPRMTAALDWWRREFAAGLAPTEFPLRKKGPGRPVSQDDWRIAWALDPAISRGLDALAEEEGATFYILRLTGVAPVLSRLAGRDEAIVGGLFTKRNRLEAQRLFGPFANLVTLPLRCNWGQSYRDFIRSMRRRVAELQIHGEIPHEHLHAEMEARGMTLTRPTIMVHLHTPHPPAAFAGLRLSWQEAERVMPRGVMIAFDQLAQGEGGHLMFDARLFDRETMGLIGEGLARFFSAAVRHPERSLGELVELAGIRPL